MAEEDPWSQYTTQEMATSVVATELLAVALARGQLFLLLGAGVSKPLGFPDWGELVTATAARAGADPVQVMSETGNDLLVAMDQVRAQCSSPGEFLGFVTEALYEHLDGVYPDDIVHVPLLNALGALVMASARGSAAEVFNLNFDDVLEWYLDLHGFTTQIVHSPPTLIRGGADVRIYHPHGFLPLVPAVTSATKIVFTKQQYVDRLSEDASAPWSTLLQSRLQSKVMLAVGTSMSDIDIATLLNQAKKYLGDTRPLGFVIGNHNDAARARLLDQGLVAVTVADYRKVPDLLLAICRRAAGTYDNP